MVTLAAIKLAEAPATPLRPHWARRHPREAERAGRAPQVVWPSRFRLDSECQPDGNRL